MNPDIVKGEIYAVYGDGDGHDEEFNNHHGSSSTEPEPEYIIDDLFDQNLNEDSNPRSPPSASAISNFNTDHDTPNIETSEEFISGDLFSDDDQPQQATTTTINKDSKRTVINDQDKRCKKIDKWVKHKCPYCDHLSFLNKLKVHCTRKHLDQDKKFNCPKCGYKINNFRSLLIHTKKHDAGGQHCLICKRLFSSHQLLQEHLNGPNHRKLTFLPCPQDGCGYLSNSSRDLAQHKEIHTNNTTTNTNTNTTRIDHPASKNEQFKCNLCNLTYKRKIEMDFHILEYHQFACPYQSCPNSKNMFSTRLELVNHITGHESTSQCKFCTSCEQFANPGELNEHIRSRHTGEKPLAKTLPVPSKTFICSHCNKEISTRALHHHKEVCPKKKDSKIICGIDSCTKEFRSKSGFYFKHKRYVHGVGVFRCCHELCDRALVFRTIEERSNHWNSSHGGRSPFVCQVCNTSFTLMDKYKVHIKKNNCQFNQDQEKSATSSKYSSIYLSKIFKCNTCPDETFTTSSSYLKHLEIIHGIGKFPCGHPACSYKGNFKTIIQRESHWNESHQGQSPFKCGECGESFKLMENLDSHLKTDCLSLNNHISNTTSTTRAEAVAEGSKAIRSIPQQLGQNIKTEEFETITID